MLLQQPHTWGSNAVLQRCTRFDEEEEEEGHLASFAVPLDLGFFFLHNER